LIHDAFGVAGSLCAERISFVCDPPQNENTKMAVPIEAVVFDLDGTCLSTEQLIVDVARRILQRTGTSLTKEALEQSIGKPQLDAWQSTIDALGLEQSAEDLYVESEAELTEHWHDASYMPGALRLIHHLTQRGQTASLKIGLATSTPRAVLAKKIQNKPLLQRVFQAVVCGDDDDIRGRGKPHPACFLKVCSLLSVEPSRTLVFEDAPSGLVAALEAGCHCVYVPSIANDSAEEALSEAMRQRVTRIPTLLAFDPVAFGLEAFRDTVEGTIPFVEHPESVIRIRGTVVKGFGRGSSELGIPTANVDTMAVARVLPGATTGIFYGWASLPDTYPGKVYATALSIGWNPFFKSGDDDVGSAAGKKTCEPWLLHDFGGEDFYGAEINVLVLGFIRPESGEFSSLEALIDRIKEDGEVTKRVLAGEAMMAFREDEFLRGQ